MVSRYLKKFREILSPRLCSYFNGLGERFGMSKEASMVTITTIWKEGKEPTLCSSYRPISLLNTDTKVFAKVVALRMRDLMSELVHLDQVGFVPGREGKDNGIRTLLLLQKIREGRTPSLFLSIDAETAFDRVDWGFMIGVLQGMGTGPRMREWIQALYKSPTASIKVNGILSAPFRMYNGTRQGCPLSPLFVLALEPLLSMVRGNVDIGGVEIGGEAHKLAAIADNVLFYISRPRISLPIY